MSTKHKEYMAQIMEEAIKHGLSESHRAPTYQMQVILHVLAVKYADQQIQIDELKEEIKLLKSQSLIDE